jgi:hypothetical protein
LFSSGHEPPVFHHNAIWNKTNVFVKIAATPRPVLSFNYVEAKRTQHWGKEMQSRYDYPRDAINVTRPLHVFYKNRKLGKLERNYQSREHITAAYHLLSWYLIHFDLPNIIFQVFFKTQIAKWQNWA